MAKKALELPGRLLAGQIKPGMGQTPAVALVNPKFGHNAGAALRACAAFGARQLWITGERALEEWQDRGRLPREERMRAYANVDVFLGDYFFDAFTPDVVPVAVEIRRSAEILTTFVHPGRALYVFGPEDGSLGSATLHKCHRVVMIPSDHCLNLATAVTLVLGHRRMQRQMLNLEPLYPSDQTLDEQRGWLDCDKPLR